MAGKPAKRAFFRTVTVPVGRGRGEPAQRTSARGRTARAPWTTLAIAALLASLFLPLGAEKAVALRQTYVFDGSGWGHGVGMCQYGARGMAAAGFDYRGVLTY